MFQGGRNYETYSEDPVVLGVLGAAFVNGKEFGVSVMHSVLSTVRNRIGSHGLMHYTTRLSVGEHRRHPQALRVQ